MNIYFSQMFTALIVILGIVGSVASIIALRITVRERERAAAEAAKANEKYAKANEEYTKGNEEYKKALDLSNSLNELVEEYKGRILDWEALVKDLAKEIRKEEESITMALDTLAYGMVSVPSAYQAFWAELLFKAASGITIRIVTFNEKARTAASRAQHGGESAETLEGPVKPIEQHLANLESLQKEGKDTVKIVLTDFFPLHLFIFGSSNVAIFAIQEIDSDRNVKSYAIRTQDTDLIAICRRIFVEMERNAQLGC